MREITSLRHKQTAHTSWVRPKWDRVVGVLPPIVFSCGKSGTTQQFLRYKSMSTENISTGDRKRHMAKAHV